METKFIAICFLGAGSVYGQAATYERAVEIASREALSFAKAFGGFKAGADPVPVNVYDYEPWDQITWSDRRVFGHKNDSKEATPLTSVRHVWIDPKSGKTVKDLTRDEWVAEFNRTKTHA